MNDKSQATLRERGVAVEAKDASADKAAFSAALASARESDTEHGWAVTPKSAQELACRAELIRTADGIEAVLCHERVVIVCKYIAFHMLPFATNGQIFATILQNAPPDIEEAAAV